MRFKEINTLFIHVPKTGGTTITHEIAKYLYGRQRNTIQLYDDPDKVIVKRSTRKAHVYARIYKRILGKVEYENLYTFGFIREPFSQISSLFSQLNSMNLSINPRFKPYKTMSFENFIFREDKFGMLGNSSLIRQDKYLKDRLNRIMVDDIFPFEYYKESLKILSKKINIPLIGYRKLRETKRNYTYTPAMINKVLDNFYNVYEFHKEVKKNFEENVLSKK